MRTLLATLSIASTLASACVIGDDPAGLGDDLETGEEIDPSDPITTGIVNPTNADDRANTHVGKLLISTPAGTSLCSSTLISPRVVVTAAHCLVNATAVRYETDGFTTTATAAASHPDYPAGRVHANDIALVLLAQPSPAAPAWLDANPAPVGRRALVVGYGRTSGTASDQGRRRSGTVKIQRVSTSNFGDMIEAVADPSLTCNGDSGGPLFDGNRLVGVVSGGATGPGGAQCQINSLFARIDRHHPFITDRLAAWGQPRTAPPPGCGRFDIDEQLLPGQSKSSCNGRFLLIHQTDGNVVLYEVADGLRPLWHTRTHGRASTTLVMQSDGNLVLYGPSGALFHTGTYGKPGTVAFVQDDGNFVLYAPGNRPVWASHTAR